MARATAKPPKTTIHTKSIVSTIFGQRLREETFLEINETSGDLIEL